MPFIMMPLDSSNIFTDQKWLFTTDKKLLNQWGLKHDKNDSVMRQKWTLPAEGAEGYIEADSGEVLGVCDPIGTVWQKYYVTLQAKNTSIDNRQVWLRRATDASGWFILENKHFERVLQFFSPNYLTAEGNQTFHNVKIFNLLFVAYLDTFCYKPLFITYLPLVWSHLTQCPPAKFLTNKTNSYFECYDKVSKDKSAIGQRGKFFRKTVFSLK